MNVVFRVDASEEIGTGHVMRCLTFARQMKSRIANIHITFICRDLCGHLIDYVQLENFPVLKLESISKGVPDLSWYKNNWQKDSQESILSIASQSINLLIVDHYGLDEKWEKALKNNVNYLMVIDDLANRKHDCHILLDQNIQSRVDRYNGLVPKDCKMLLGTDYCLLREEFMNISDQIKIRDGNIKNVLISYGGTDPQQLTLTTVEILQNVDFQELNVHVVVGVSNPNRQKIEEMCKKNERFFYYCQIDFMANLMNQVDLAIGAGGTSSWERLYVGLPSLTVIIANNQIEMTKLIEEEGATICLGWNKQMVANNLIKTLLHLMKFPSLMREMSKKSLRLVNKEKVNNYPALNAVMEVCL